MSVSENILHIKKSLPEQVTLVAVSKTHPAEAILEAYQCGQRIFGENKVQELTAKFETLPKDIQWHFIGHLQTNKVKYIAPFVSLIHSIDSLNLLQIINKEALKNNRIIDVLLEIHIAQEESKFGLSRDSLYELLNDENLKSLENIRICGLMGMATFTEDENQVNQEFAQLKAIFDDCKKTFFIDREYFTQLSMGMSDDYPIAIKNGSTLVRIGSAIWGNRIYK